jgi:hypothetical protein
MALKLALVHQYAAEPANTLAVSRPHSAPPISYLPIVVMLFWIAYLALIAMRIVPEIPLPGINHRALNYQSLT